MESVKTDAPKKLDGKDEEHSLKGAVVSASLVTAFIIVSWTAVFLLYLSRV
ncbi:MAG TPA: cytochrome c oxidase subunit 2A [Bacilli bacterium]